ncbi:hypothetical protein RLEG12_01035 (plasmid) [Rhizobium leguminosarum bv. trifolii CB782]|nr:hypothetical protein RLEG12_01035 [Rhizobium leguminosarum bv. trifolii CB782]
MRPVGRTGLSGGLTLYEPGGEREAVSATSHAVRLVSIVTVSSKEEHMTMSTKTAVVTGSSRGIGFGIAQILLQRKMNVVLNGRDIASLKSAHASLGPLGQRASLFAGDICDGANAEELVLHAVERFGKLIGEQCRVA